MASEWGRLRRAKRALCLAAFLALGLAGLQGWSWYDERDVRLSRSPPRVPHPRPPAAQDSQISVRAHIDYQDIRRSIEVATAAPQAGEEAGETCRNTMGGHFCVGWKVRYAAHRVEGVEVRQHDDRMRIVVPVVIRGQVSFHGALASILGLGEKVFEAALDGIADLAIDLDANWCPSVALDVGLVWRERPRLELARDDAVDLSEQVEDPVRRAIAQVQHQIQHALNCEVLRQQIARLWHPQTFPLEGKPGSTGLHLNIVPTKLELSGITAESDRLVASVRLTARTAIANVAASTATLPLPTLARVQQRRGDVVVSLPLTVTYDRLRQAIASELDGKTFTAEVIPGRMSRARVTAAEVYPSGERLVAAFRFVAETGLPVLDTAGTFYVSAKPQAAERMRVRFSEFGIARVVDNPLWRVASVLFESDILNALRKRATFDLQPETEEATRLAVSMLTRYAATNGMDLHLVPPSVTLNGLFTAEDSLVAEVILRSRAELRLKGSLLQLP